MIISITSTSLAEESYSILPRLQTLPPLLDPLPHAPAHSNLLRPTATYTHKHMSTDAPKPQAQQQPPCLTSSANLIVLGVPVSALIPFMIAACSSSNSTCLSLSIASDSRGAGRLQFPDEVRISLLIPALSTRGSEMSGSWDGWLDGVRLSMGE